jgi:predicted dehydrogenase
VTVPAVHAEVAGKAIAAGKNLWSEKPISVDRQSGRGLLVDRVPLVAEAFDPFAATL